MSAQPTNEDAMRSLRLIFLADSGSLAEFGKVLEPVFSHSNAFNSSFASNSKRFELNGHTFPWRSKP